MISVNTTEQFFTVLIRNLAVIKNDVECNPVAWRKALGAALEQGSFLRLDFAAGHAGVVESRLVLVSMKGETCVISQPGVSHV